VTDRHAPADPDLVAALADFARRVAGRDGSPAVLSHRTGELVLRCGAVVVKAHAAGTDRDSLNARLDLVESPRLREVLLAPLARGEVDGRPVTVWPVGAALRPDDAFDAPWDVAGTLLARLHAVEPPQAVPPAGGPARVTRALHRLAASPAWPGPRSRTVRTAYEMLPAWTRGAGAQPRAVLTHGDWHLGQLVRVAEGWRLIDADQLGAGEPTWDLARPAAWFAAGLMPPELWDRFLGAYRAAGGVAVPPDGDPWPVLDAPARALAVQTAALAIVNADLDVAEAFVACCRRINGLEQTRYVRTLSKLLRV
jgi:hypothetical protein